VRRLLVTPLPLALLLVAGCSTALTPTRLDASFAVTFSGLYALQQEREGRQGVDADALAATARCTRSGTAAQGPGEDWSCAVTYRDSATLFTQSFELQVKSDGCWRAEAPPTAQPARGTHRVTGATFVNPLAEFDGCVDTSWR
jgi:hypothetical protein